MGKTINSLVANLIHNNSPFCESKFSELNSSILREHEEQSADVNKKSDLPDQNFIIEDRTGYSNIVLKVITR